MGSGKSEIAINYALLLKRENQKEVRLLDLDIIKPYIRLRDVAEKIEFLNIDLLMPELNMRHADMPIVPHHMIEYLTDPNYDLVLDVGGEERGCITIAQFQEYFNQSDLSVNLVINPYRPFSDSLGKVLYMIDSLQNKSKLKVTGLISNPHLRFDTNLNHVILGTKLVEEVSNKSKIPIRYVCIWHSLLTDTFLDQFKQYSILPIRLYLTFPWENGLIEGL